MGKTEKHLNNSNRTDQNYFESTGQAETDCLLAPKQSAYDQQNLAAGFQQETNGMERQRKCRYCHPLVDMETYKVQRKCFAGRKSGTEVREVQPEDCASCSEYDSRFIEYPIEVSNILAKIPPYWKDPSCGTLVKIRPCGEEYGDRTYIGFLLGDLPVSPYISFSKGTKELNVSATLNPAIFVPELKQIIFGLESWWEKIDGPEDLSDITDADINNTWYVALLKNVK